MTKEKKVAEEAQATEEKIEQATPAVELPALPEFLQNHPIRTLNFQDGKREFVLLNQNPLTFQNQEKQPFQQLIVEYWLDRISLQVFVVANWASPVGTATTNIFPRSALFTEQTFHGAMAKLLDAGFHVDGPMFAQLRLMMMAIDPFNGAWVSRGEKKPESAETQK